MIFGSEKVEAHLNEINKYIWDSILIVSRPPTSRTHQLSIFFYQRQMLPRISKKCCNNLTCLIAIIIYCLFPSITIRLSFADCLNYFSTFNGSICSLSVLQEFSITTHSQSRSLVSWDLSVPIDKYYPSINSFLLLTVSSTAISSKGFIDIFTFSVSHLFCQL